MADEDDTEEFETVYQVYRRLTDIVMNETQSPELLHFEEAIIDIIVDQIHHMNKNLTEARRLNPFAMEMHKTELERFTFIVNKYYRTRLEKIETNSQQLVKLLQTNKALAFKLMSPVEIKYLDNYIASIDSNLKRVLLEQMPPTMRAFSLMSIPVDPAELHNRYVFVKALKDTTMMADDPASGTSHQVEMEAGDKNFLPYALVKHHFQSGSKDLLLL